MVSKGDMLQQLWKASSSYSKKSHTTQHESDRRMNNISNFMYVY